MNDEKPPLHKPPSGLHRLARQSWELAWVVQAIGTLLGIVIGPVYGWQMCLWFLSPALIFVFSPSSRDSTPQSKRSPWLLTPGLLNTTVLVATYWDSDFSWMDRAFLMPVGAVVHVLFGIFLGAVILTIQDGYERSARSSRDR